MADLIDFDKLPATRPGPPIRHQAGRKPFNIDSILTRPDPDRVIEKVKYIIPDMAARGDVVLLMGPQKDGKTFLSTRIACEVSTGGDLLDGFASVEPHKV